jgi:hypothetical protein
LVRFDEIGCPLLSTMLADVADKWPSTRVAAWFSAVERVLAACSLRCCCVLPAVGPHATFVDIFGVKQRSVGADEHVLKLAMGFVIVRGD